MHINIIVIVVLVGSQPTMIYSVEEHFKVVVHSSVCADLGGVRC